MRASGKRLRGRLMNYAAPISVLLFAAGAAPGVYAQEAAPANADTVGEVVVTAQFRAQNLQSTPIAITAVNAAMLEQRGQTDVSQVAAQAPNVTLKAAGGQGSSSMVAFIRGVGQTDFNFALEPGVGVYVDDVYFATLAGSLLDLLDLERVEVLRGPQGTLAGKNSIGGAIKMYTKKPVGEGGYLQATTGSYNRIDARGAADFTVIPDQLFARISIATKHHDGYVDRIDYGCSHPGSGLPTLKSGDGCKLGTLGGQSYTAGRMALRWTPNSKLEVNWSADIINDNSEAVANTLLEADPKSQQTLNGVTYDGKFITYGPLSKDPNHPNNPYMTYATFVDPGGFPGFTDPVTGNNKSPSKPVVFSPLNTFHGYGTNLNMVYKLTDDLQLTSISSYRYYDNTFSDDTDGSPIAVEQLQQKLVSRQWSQELRMNGSYGKLLDYTVGGFINRQSGTLRARVDLPYVNAGPGQFGPLDFIHGPDITKSRTMAVFLHTDWHLTDRLGVSGGVRYSLENKLYAYQRHNPDGTVPQACLTTPLTQNGITYIPPFRPDNPQNCSLFGLNGSSARFPGPTGDAKRWDYRVDVNYKFTDTILGYANISTGYKGGGVNPRPFYIQQEQPFGPETLTAYELGLKTQLFDRRVRFNTAAFFNKYNNMILSLSNCPFAGAPATPCALPSNVGRADVKGIEFEAEVRPVTGMLIDASLSYLDFKYKYINPITNIRPDMVTPYTPKWKWSVGAQYDLPFLTGTLTPRIDASYQSDIYTNAINCGPARAATTSPAQAAICGVPDANLIKGYTLFNGRIGWRSKDNAWTAAFEVQNLTNKLYYTTLFDSSTSAGYVAGSPGMPRTYSVTIKRSF